MIRFSLIIWFFACITPIAFGESLAAVKRPNKKALRPSRKKSKDLRLKQRHVVQTTWGISAAGLETSLGYEYHVNSRYGIETYIHQVREEYKTSKANYQVLFVAGKRYFGNNFYLAGGLGLADGKLKFPYVVSEDLDSLGKYSYTYTTLFSEFYFGNAWELGNFHVGCDWLGVRQPLFIIRKKETNSLTAEDVGYETKESRKYALRSTAIFLRLHLGVSF